MKYTTNNKNEQKNIQPTSQAFINNFNLHLMRHVKDIEWKKQTSIIYE